MKSVKVESVIGEGIRVECRAKRCQGEGVGVQGAMKCVRVDRVRVKSVKVERGEGGRGQGRDGQGIKCQGRNVRV
jgi:hypothetical protein